MYIFLIGCKCCVRTTIISLHNDVSPSNSQVHRSTRQLKSFISQVHCFANACYIIRNKINSFLTGVVRETTTVLFHARVPAKSLSKIDGFNREQRQRTYYFNIYNRNLTAKSTSDFTTTM